MDNVLGRRLKEQRLQKNITQEELGKKVGVLKQAVWKWEKGINKPNSEMLLKICEALHCTTDYLVGKANTPEGVIYEHTDKDLGLVTMEYPAEYKLTQEEYLLFIDELKKEGYDVESMIKKIKSKSNKDNKN